MALFIFITCFVFAAVVVALLRLRRVRFSPNKYILTAAAIGIVAGSWLIAQQSSRFEQSKEMKGWPTVKGLIVNSWLEGERAMHPIVKYAYAVGSVEYIKEDTIYTPSFGGKRRKYEVSVKTLVLYTPGDSIDVYYNPAEASEAHLGVHESWDLFGKLSFGVTLLVLALIMLFAPKRPKV